mmetsp:Transcript_34724/g.53294  ORF Transcript_34724/g.53294 Transcript_34724/m.53294 type:complete len:198 (+) Transcript_34724:1027-1620(+)
MAKIREATGVSEVNDVIHKFATQGDTLETLKDLKTQNEKKLLALTEKRQNVKDNLEKMKLEGLEALTRKQVEDMERNLSTAEQKHEKANEAHDTVKKKLLDLWVGIENMTGKLNEIKLEGRDEAGNPVESIQVITLSNLVQGLEQSRKKLKLLYTDLKSDPKLFAEAVNHVQGGGLSGNQQQFFKDSPMGNFFSRPN